ncbi:MAG: proteasome activator [Acidimicrobiia bacterium]
MEDALKPDVIEEGTTDGKDKAPEISEPSKLIRIASMTRAMLEEARQAPLDESGRRRMAKVHEQSVEELRDVLSPELQEEFGEIMIPLSTEGSSEAELRVAQAQLIGWLEGLFHGIQASLWSQQMTAQTQLAEMQQRALGAPQRAEGDASSGLYL